MNTTECHLKYVTQIGTHRYCLSVGNYAALMFWYFRRRYEFVFREQRKVPECLHPECSKLNAVGVIHSQDEFRRWNSFREYKSVLKDLKWNFINYFGIYRYIILVHNSISNRWKGNKMMSRYIGLIYGEITGILPIKK